MTLLLLLLLCSHSPYDVPPPEPKRNVSIAAVRGAVRPSKNDTVEFNPLYIVLSLALELDSTVFSQVYFYHHLDTN